MKSYNYALVSIFVFHITSVTRALMRTDHDCTGYRSTPRSQPGQGLQRQEQCEQAAELYRLPPNMISEQAAELYELPPKAGYNWELCCLQRETEAERNLIFD